MPILVRPVREQLEHDRVIRHLQAKLKRKYDVVTNVGDEKNAGIKSGTLTLYPDLVLNSGRKTVGLIEVETNESVNHLEAMAQWAHFARTRLPFHLYVPANAVEMARRLAEEIHAPVSEIWSFHVIGDQVRFALIHRGAAAPAPPAPPPTPKAAAPKPSAARTAAKRARVPTRGTGGAKSAAGKRGTRPARRAAGNNSAKKTSRTQKRK